MYVGGIQARDGTGQSVTRRRFFPFCPFLKSLNRSNCGRTGHEYLNQIWVQLSPQNAMKYVANLTIGQEHVNVSSIRNPSRQALNS